MNNFFQLIILSFLLLLCSCSKQPELDRNFVDRNLSYAEKQLDLLRIDATSQNRLPRTVEDNRILWTDEYDYIDWTEGFFPGTCWYLYEYTKDKKWKDSAEKLQALFEADKLLTATHDLGFIFNSSYGNAFRLTNNPCYKETILQAAHSLSSRFRSSIGLIQSWDVNGTNWQSFRGWQYPVIIDNLMNLELLFKATELGGDSTYYKIAVAHADHTLANHFREDNSCYHVVDYDSITGKVHVKQTAQGYADESRWARGQAWALYGYTMCYRFTHLKRYLEQAVKVADFILHHPAIPADYIPYWDYDVPNKEKQPRDASAAAVTASALIELSQYTQSIIYKDKARDILESLSSPEYMAAYNTNQNFLLMHSTGSIPHKGEIDKPLNYADYYYVEALLRLYK